MTTKTENGMQFPAEAYAYVPDANDSSTWKLRLWETPAKKETKAQVGRAVAAIGKGFRGQKVQLPEGDRATVKAKIMAAWTKVHKTPAPKESATPAAMKQEQVPAALKEAATTELNQISDLVCDALDDKLQPNVPDYMAPCYSMEALFPDRVIVEQDGRYWSYAYSIGEDNQVTLGDAQEVLATFEQVGSAAADPMQEALALDAAFLEAKSPDGSLWDVRIIRAGVSGNNVLYPDAVLREAAPAFDGARVYARPDGEHVAKGPMEARDVNKIVGWISNPHFTEAAGAAAGQLLGRLNLSPTPFREVLADAWKRGKKDLMGLSINARGEWDKPRMVEGRQVRVAKSIKKVDSVDLIVEPGAGGGLVRLVEAAAEETTDMKLKERMLQTIKAKNPAAYAKINPETVTDDALEAAYQEALVEKPAAAAGAGLTAEQVAGIVAEQTRMVEARANMRVAIAESKLPEPARQKLAADFGARDRFTEADVAAAIKAERVYVARFTESGKVKLDTEGNIEVEDRSVKITDMLDAFFDKKHKNHRNVQSFKECYIEITGDRRVTGRMDDVDRARMAESLGAAFRESMDSTSLANVLGDSITRRMVAEYNIQSQYDAWRQIATTVPVQDFRTQDRTLFGGYGSLPAVAQGAPYAALGSPSDQQATYGVTKRGGTEDVTLEMIKNDDVGVIRRIPVKLAGAAKRTLGTFVFDFIRTNPLIYDGVAFFDNAHNNLGTTALAAAELGVARRAMMKQTELGSGARMSIPPKSILVPLDLVETAWNIFQRGTNLDKTYIETMLLTIIPVWYWTDATDWAIAADPNDIPGIEIGFLDGQEEPELFVQDMPNVGSMFSNDKLTYKIRHIYGGNVLPGGEKAFYKEVVAG